MKLKYLDNFTGYMKVGTIFQEINIPCKSQIHKNSGFLRVLKNLTCIYFVWLNYETMTLWLTFFLQKMPLPDDAAFSKPFIPASMSPPVPLNRSASYPPHPQNGMPNG